MEPPTFTNTRDDTYLVFLAELITTYINEKRKHRTIEANYHKSAARMVESQWREKNGLKPTS